MSNNNKRNLSVCFIIFALFLSCNRKSPEINSLNDTDFNTNQIDEKYLEPDIENNNTEDINSYIEMKIHEDSYLKHESAALITPDNNIWTFGRTIDQSFLEKENTTAYTDVFTRSGGPYFGPIAAMEDEYLKIGWNRHGVIFYIEALSNDVLTFDGIRLGDSKEKILNVLGVPFIEYEDLFKYVCKEQEPEWLLFSFEDDIVTKIILLLFF